MFLFIFKEASPITITNENKRNNPTLKLLYIILYQCIMIIAMISDCYLAIG